MSNWNATNIRSHTFNVYPNQICYGRSIDRSIDPNDLVVQLILWSNSGNSSDGWLQPIALYQYMLIMAECLTDMKCFWRTNFLLLGLFEGRFHDTLYKLDGNQNLFVIRLRRRTILCNSVFNAPSRMKDCQLHSTHGTQISSVSNFNFLKFQFSLISIFSNFNILNSLKSQWTEFCFICLFISHLHLMRINSESPPKI